MRTISRTRSSRSAPTGSSASACAAAFRFSARIYGASRRWIPPRGYVAWGGPPPLGPLDGTLVPAAAGGSLAFLPQESIRTLRAMRQRFGARVWKRYGFVDAFNPQTGWYDPDVIGIDVGITVLMAENARTQFVWRTFTKNEEAGHAMSLAGFVPELRGGGQQLVTVGRTADVLRSAER